jgi:uncharacterized protein
MVKTPTTGRNKSILKPNKMKTLIFFVLLFTSFLVKAQTSTFDYPIKPVDFTNVKIMGGFWQNRLDTIQDKTIPYTFKKCEENHRIDNFIHAGRFHAGRLKEGKFKGKFGFDDSDLYKVMEGASYSLLNKKNQNMEKYLDTLISYIAAAQEPDGYLYTPWTLSANDYNKFLCCTYDSKNRFLGDYANGSHELYNAGHMYEAAVAHFNATGKRNFLNIALKNADLIYQLKVVDKQDFFSGHQEIEIGLVKLYRVTNNKKYLDLAKLFLERRGRKLQPIENTLNNLDYTQNHIPVIDQTEAVGHSVRAAYMYAAMVDIAAITGDKAYENAVDKIWENIVGKKMYVTGGLGAVAGIEGFDKNYKLPNNAYAETCAAIANVYFNHRLFLLHGDSKYIDVLEKTIYNGLMAGISLDGDKFLYPNPLEFDGKEKFNQGAVCRSNWFDCSCCPTNLARFVPSISGYAYAVKNAEVYVNLFMDSKANLMVNQQKISLTQSTNYPWAGSIKMTLGTDKNVKASLKIRIPGWATNEVVPSDLYTYHENSKAKTIIKINNKPVDFLVEKGYAAINKTWKNGDNITIDFPMEVKTLVSHKEVKDNTGKLAVQRGPILYCAEGLDNNFNLLNEIGVNIKALSFQTVESKSLGGATFLSTKGTIKDKKDTPIVLVPYVVWGHRGQSSMSVWLNDIGASE